MKTLLACLAPGLPGAAGAQAVSERDWRASDRALPEPRQAQGRSFSNGVVRLAVPDRVEPAAGTIEATSLPGFR